MSSAISATSVLTTIARSLVVAQKYPNIEEALRGMALAEVQRKIAYYRNRIR